MQINIKKYTSAHGHVRVGTRKMTVEMVETAACFSGKRSPFFRKRSPFF